MKKILSICAMSLFLGAAIVGCSGSSTTAGGGPGGSGAKDTVKDTAKDTVKDTIKAEVKKGS